LQRPICALAASISQTSFKRHCRFAIRRATADGFVLYPRNDVSRVRLRKIAQNDAPPIN
jgi:hypothetical protein